MKKQIKYKFLREGMKSDSGNLIWKIGEWQHEKGTLDICKRGLHCSLYPDQAFSYVRGEILAIVEAKGESIIQDDKECWSSMRIVKAYKWTSTDSVELAIYAAELVIDIYEKKYPHDDRPRKAIEAAKIYLKNPATDAADAATYAARAAYAAAHAADAAAYAADAAAYAATDAPDAAAHAAHAAAYAADAAAYATTYATYATRAAADATYATRAAARAAAYAAARAADAAHAAAYAADAKIVKKIRHWMTKRIKTLQKII